MADDAEEVEKVGHSCKLSSIDWGAHISKAASRGTLARCGKDRG